MFDRVEIYCRKLKKIRSFEPGKWFKTRFFSGCNWDILRSCEPESKISHSCKKTSV